MTDETTNLDHPIDVQYLMHKAYRAVSLQVEGLASDLQDGGDIQAFTDLFGAWGKHLLFHAVTEDTYMTAPLENSQPARDNGEEHAGLGALEKELGAFMRKGESAGLEESIKAVLAFEEEQHEELLRRMRDVEDVLTKEIGEGAVSARTGRHLYNRVVALRVAEFDHFENEEAFVFPIVRARMDEAQQLALARRLLIEDGADDPRWIIDLVAELISPEERKLLSELEARF